MSDKIGPRKDHQRVIKLLTHPKQGYYSGVLMCDGASNFTKAQKEMGSFVIANDWAHVRRKFVEAAPDFPVASEMVELIGELFEIERNAKESDVDFLDARIKFRTEFSLSILEKIRKWMQNNAEGWQGSNLNRAIKYTDKRWEKLVYFATYPEVPLHNNPAEFALRNPVPQGHFLRAYEAERIFMAARVPMAQNLAQWLIHFAKRHESTV